VSPLATTKDLLMPANKLMRSARTATCCLLLGGCATSIISPELEDQVGTEMAYQVQDQIGLYPDEPLHAYVNAVGERLVQALGPSPYTFRFAVVDQIEPNAFAAPGGFIYISRGLLAQMNSEAELAGVLAHEISHVTRRHHAKQIGRTVGAGLLTLPGRAVGVVSEDVGNMINAPIEAAGEVYLSSFSREQELDADAQGLQLAAAAGYAPMALAEALEGIERSLTFLTGETHEADYLDTHPTTPARVADIQRKSARLTVQPQPPLADRAALLAHLDGLWCGPQNPQGGVFVEQLFLNADLNFAIRFPDGWETINTPRFVGAGREDGAAFIALGPAPHQASLAELGDAVVENMRQRTGLEPALRRRIEDGRWPAELVRYDDNSGEQTVSLYYLFVKAPGDTFRLIAMGLEQYREQLRATALSLAPLSEQQRDMISGHRLRLVIPRANESLEQLSARSGNRWPPAYTAIVNGLDDGAPLPVGAPLKIMKLERYPD
jgi:predicted Zn-dependent protease